MVGEGREANRPPRRAGRNWEPGGLGPHRVYYSVFGSGLGHITRMLEVERRLGDGYRGLISTSGQGLDHVRAEGDGAEAVECPPLDVEWKGHGFSSWHVLPHFPFTFNNFLRQLAFERRSIAKFDPRVVVSDSKLSPVLAGSSLSRPVVTLLNQFLVSFPPRFRGRMGRHYERVAGDVLGLLWSLSDRVLMTDLPPPYTIAESTLVGSDVSRVVEFVGFMAPKAAVGDAEREKVKAALGIDARPLVFCQISGPDETKERLAWTVREGAKALARDYNVVISMGISGGSTIPTRTAGGALVFEWCPVKEELFAMASLLVARAGHSTIGQCIDKAKPALLVPIHNHPEQIGNAEKFSKLGLGMSIRAERLTPASLTEAVRSIVGDQGYRTRMEAASGVSRRYDGLERTAEVIRSYF